MNRAMKKGIKKTKRKRIIEKRYQCHKTAYACSLVHPFKSKPEIKTTMGTTVNLYEWREQKQTKIQKLWQKLRHLASQTPKD